MIYNITHQTSTWYYSDSVQCIYQVVRRREVGGDVVMSCKYCTHQTSHPNLLTKFNVFPFSNFRYFSLFFQSSFSSFHHCTCSLSVSGFYLAFDGFYHLFVYYITNKLLFRSALPSKSTLSFHYIPCV